jgi:hypothetical protein
VPWTLIHGFLLNTPTSQPSPKTKVEDIAAQTIFSEALSAIAVLLAKALDWGQPVLTRVGKIAHVLH